MQKLWRCCLRLLSRFSSLIENIYFLSLQSYFVGADQVALNGDTANKIGTYQLAILAKHFCVPFYVVTPVSSINPRISSGQQIVIEERPADELKKFNGNLLSLFFAITFIDFKQSLNLLGIYIAPPNATAWNPAFDVTPADLITSVLTDKGNVRPDAVKSLFE